MNDFHILVEVSHTSAGINPNGKVIELMSDLSIFKNLTDKHVIAALAFIGGFIDATGFIKLHRLFTASITGNLVVACTDLFENPHDILVRVLVCAAFGIGAFCVTVLAMRLRHQYGYDKWTTGKSLFGLEIVCLTVAMVVCVVLEDTAGGFLSIRSWQTMLAACLLGFSTGVHNGAALDFIPNCPSTTVMTMTIVKTSISAANAFMYYLASKSIITLSTLTGSGSGGDSRHADYEKKVMAAYLTNRTKFLASMVNIFAFTLGAIVGAGSFAVGTTFWSLMLPITLLAIIVTDIHLASMHSSASLLSLEQAASNSSSSSSSSSSMNSGKVLLSGNDSRNNSGAVEMQNSA